MKLNPLADRVVVKMVEMEETTKSGIVLTSSVKETPQIAKVIAVGPGGLVNGKEVKFNITSEYIKRVGEKCVGSYSFVLAAIIFSFVKVLAGLR